MRNIICDIDGTVADVRHRLHHILNPSGSKRDDPQWDAFHAACVYDVPVRHVIEVVYRLKFPGTHVHFITGRNEVVRRETVDWMGKNVGPVFIEEYLHMRKQGDRRPDTQVKLEHAMRLGLDPSNVVCVLEDRQSVVDMWRGQGFLCLQVAQWEEK